MLYYHIEHCNFTTKSIAFDGLQRGFMSNDLILKNLLYLQYNETESLPVIHFVNP
jgi:hypothetical protein